MNSYRDDNQDTAIASDSTFGGLRSAVDEVLRVSDKLLFGIAIVLSSSAIASDEVIDSSAYSFVDTAIVADEVIDTKHAIYNHIESVKITDTITQNVMALHSDSAAISDFLIPATTSGTINDSAIASDSVTSQRNVITLVYDSAKVSDAVGAVVRYTIEDTAVIADKTTDKLLAINIINDGALAQDEVIASSVQLIIDSAIAGDEVKAKRNVVSSVLESLTIKDALLFNRGDTVTDTVSADGIVIDQLFARGLLIDSAAMSDEVIDTIGQNTAVSESVSINEQIFDKLSAAVLIVDSAVIQDEILNIGGYRGQAWTSNVDSWAMSRYEPYNFNRLVVIDGVLYGEADDGIYQLDQPASPVVASIRTGKMDLGNGQLTHPATAYLEYELSGNAAMSVTTTQKGSEQTYTYALPNELAGELTNGRFIFGRGLRGRHFSFELVMIGTHGHINDLSIEHFPTSRRV